MNSSKIKLKSCDDLKSVLSSSKGKKKLIYKQCLLILEEFPKSYIVSEYKRIIDEIEIHKSRIQTEETKLEIKALTSRKNLIKLLFANGTTRYIRASKPSSSKNKEVKQTEIE